MCGSTEDQPIPGRRASCRGVRDQPTQESVSELLMWIFGPVWPGDVCLFVGPVPQRCCPVCDAPLESGAAPRAVYWSAACRARGGVVHAGFAVPPRASRSRLPSVMVDSRSVKASETVGRATRGWDGGKLINGRKRHMICHRRILLLLVMVAPADAQDPFVARELP